MRRVPLAVLGAYALLLLAFPSHAQEAPERATVLLTAGGQQAAAIPLALPYAVGGTGVARDFWGVVKRDLELTGVFTVIDPAAYTEPAGTGIRPGDFDLATWKTPGAAVLGKTSLVTSGDGLRAEVFVYDVGGGGKLAGKAFTAGGNGMRALAHRVADTIFSAVTNERSFFDTRFSFAGSFSGNKEIYVMDVDGYGRRQITKNKSINLSPRWSRQGGALCFTSYVNNNPDLYVADLGKGQIRRVSARQGINTGCAWSPDGGTLALTLSVGSDSEIFSIDPVAGRELARLTSSPGIDVNPSFSPDGSRIAFMSERGGGPQIYVMNANGTGVKRVTFQGSHNVTPAWSPKGDRIAFCGRDGNFDVFTVKPDGTDMRRVTQGQGDNEDPSWAPEGDYLAFSSTRTGASHIWIASVDGNRQVQVTTGGGGYTNPNWSGHLSW